jgi:LmbE family N-acetylglucosaminyl deacetylase
MVKKLNINDYSGKKILAVGAHPDDVEFAAGGTLALLSRRNRITLVIVTDGGAGTKDPHINRKTFVVEREKETHRAVEILGIQEVMFFRYPDLGLNGYRNDFFQKFLRLLVGLRPDIVISWDFWGRYELLVHPDHRVVAEVVMEAVLEATLPNRLKRWSVFAAEPLGPKPEQWLMIPAEPNNIVDISDVSEVKWQALREHRSQDGVQERERLERKYFSPAGKLIGVRFGEAFRIMRDM